MSRVGLTGLPSVDCPLQSLTGKVQSVVRDLKRRRELVERKRKELDEYVRASGWRDIRGDPKDILVVNVGGEGFTVPRSTLTCVSESLLCDLFSGAFDHMLVPYQPAASTSPSSPTSPSVCSSTPPPIFLDVDPTAFRAILRVLVAYEHDNLLSLEPRKSEKEDPSVVFYFDLLLSRPTGGDDSGSPAAASTPCMRALQRLSSDKEVTPVLQTILDDVQEIASAVEGLERDVMREEESLKEGRKTWERRLRRAGMFLMSEGEGVRSVSCLGVTVATCLSTLSVCGEDSNLYFRFCKWNPTLLNASPDYFARAVDYYRRKRLAPHSVVCLPSLKGDDKEGLFRALGMYGTFPDLVGTSALLTGATALSSLSAYLSQALNTPIKTIECLYRASKDGWAFPDLERKMQGKGPFVLLLSPKPPSQEGDNGRREQGRGMVGAFVDQPFIATAPGLARMASFTREFCFTVTEGGLLEPVFPLALENHLTCRIGSGSITIHQESSHSKDDHISGAFHLAFAGGQMGTCRVRVGKGQTGHVWEALGMGARMELEGESGAAEREVEFATRDVEVFIVER